MAPGQVVVPSHFRTLVRKRILHLRVASRLRPSIEHDGGGTPADSGSSLSNQRNRIEFCDWHWNGSGVGSRGTHQLIRVGKGIRSRNISLFTNILLLHSGISTEAESNILQPAVSF